MSYEKSVIYLNIIQNYILKSKNTGLIGLIPDGARDIKIYGLKKLNKTINEVYDLSINYFYNSENKKINLILKLYPDDKRRFDKEYKILCVLERANFRVPHVFIQERNEKVLGAPFIIMKKIEGRPIREQIKKLNSEELFYLIKCFAKTLVNIHELEWKEIGVDFIEPPKDKYSFAKKQALWKEILPDYINKENFDWVSNWLKYNAEKNPCLSYSLIRNDMNLRNFFFIENDKIITLDWEWTEIGDSLIDVAYAYHNIRHAFGVRRINTKGARVASLFLKQYVKYSSRKISFSSLRFYLLSAGLREAIYARYVKNNIINPFFTKKNFGIKYLLIIPLLWWHYRSRYKNLENYLRKGTIDYEQAMFETRGGRILSEMEIKNILDFLEARPSELVLDIGTGSGRISRKIKTVTNADVIAMDASKQAAQSAKRRMDAHQRNELIIADGQYLPFKDYSFNGIVCIRAIKYFPDYMLGISEMSRVLKPYGRLIIDFSNILGYEILLRRFSHATSARGHHLFNFYKMRNILCNNKLVVIDTVSLQKIPHKIWNFSSNLKILQLLIIGEHLLRKITPLTLSRSILTKCIKH